MKNGQHDFTHLKFEPGFPVDLLRQSEAFIKKELGINITLIARVLDQPSGVSHMKKLMTMLESYQSPPLDSLGTQFSAKTYDELFHFYNIHEGVAQVMDTGYFIDSHGNVMTEEVFKRSLPFKQFISNGSKGNFDFYSKYYQDVNRTKFAKLLFMKEENGWEDINYDDNNKEMTQNFKKRYAAIEEEGGKRTPFDGGLSDIRYLFDITKDWPILGKYKIPPMLSYNAESNVRDWISHIGNISERKGITSLFSFKPFFPLKEVENSLLIKGAEFHVSSIPCLNHLFMLTGRNTELMIFVLRYFAQIAQYPNRRFGGTGLIFYSRDQGSGKSLFVKLMLALFDPYVGETQNLECDLFGRFSGNLEEKILLHLEDVPGPQLTKFKEYLKGSITADSIRVERKGKDAYRISNFCRYIISTNVIEKLEIEPTDRRWSIIPCTNEISLVALEIATSLKGEVNGMMVEDEPISERAYNRRVEPDDLHFMRKDEEGKSDLDTYQSSNDEEDNEDIAIRKIKKDYFSLLNHYWRGSFEVKQTFLKMLCNSVNTEGFHPEQSCPVNILNWQASKKKVPVLEEFMMGMGNTLFLNGKDAALFCSYIPRKRHDDQELKRYAWMLSTELLDFYNNSWLPSSNFSPKHKLNKSQFATQFKEIGNQVGKDFSSQRIRGFRHLPIDWRYWHEQHIKREYDSLYTIDIQQLRNQELTRRKSKIDGFEGNLSFLKLG
jgi:hypothetical protein